MIPKVNNSVKITIISILENKVFEKLNKSQQDFIVLWHILSIKGRINFLQLERFSTVCEQTYRNQFEKPFDPGYIPKTWQTPSEDQLAKKGLNLLSH